MSTPLNDIKCIIAMYDSYAKTVMRNACRNILKSERKRRNHEVLGIEKMQYLFDNQQHIDIYPSEHIVISENLYICVITSDKLYRAMMQLSDSEKAVIILDFWYGWTDSQIADFLKISLRTVYNRRQKAFRSIKNYYERIRDE